MAAALFPHRGAHAEAEGQSCWPLEVPAVLGGEHIGVDVLAVLGAGPALGHKGSARPRPHSRQNGRVGQAAGFEVLKSNNLPDGPGAGAGKSMIAGYRGATTLAEQIVSTEAFRLEKRFADGVKGLHVYGTKVTRPTGLVVADVIVS